MSWSSRTRLRSFLCDLKPIDPEASSSTQITTSKALDQVEWNLAYIGHSVAYDHVEIEEAFEAVRAEDRPTGYPVSSGASGCHVEANWMGYRMGKIELERDEHLWLHGDRHPQCSFSDGPFDIPCTRGMQR